MDLMLQAKWALDYHDLEYKVTKYTPGLGETWLRKRTGKKGGIITTPVMFTPDGMPFRCYHSDASSFWDATTPLYARDNALPTGLFLD